MDKDASRQLSRFKDPKKIGEGTYGIVYRARCSNMNAMVALKQIRLNQGNEGVPATAIREICLLKELSHPNIVKLHDVILNKGQRLYMVFEYVDQDLKMLMEKVAPRPLPIVYIKSFLFQLLQALAYCHTHRVVHRDLKPQNLLVMNTGIIKLADFGLARFAMSFDPSPNNRRAHLDRFQFRQDATPMKWSLACIFAETIRGSPLFDGDSEIDQLFRIFRVLGTPTPTIWPGVEKFPDYKADFPKWNATDLRRYAPAIDDDGLDLLEMMLAYPPMERITAKAALCHRYLLNVPIATALPDISTLFSKT